MQDARGLTFDPVIGEVPELQAFNAMLSKRASQITHDLAAFEAQWDAAYPGQESDPVMSARLQAKAWITSARTSGGHGWAARPVGVASWTSRLVSPM